MASRLPAPPVKIQPEALVAWLREHLPATGRLVSDSRRVQPGDAFFALAGQRQQGSAFIVQALEMGAAAVVVAVLRVDTDARAVTEFLRTVLPEHNTVPVCLVPGLSDHLGLIADAWYQHPSHAMDVVAVTGTNGKTSTTHWIAQGINDLRAQALGGGEGRAAQGESRAPADAAATGTAGAGVADTADSGADAADTAAQGEAAPEKSRPEALIMALDGEGEREVPVPEGGGVVIGTNGVGRPGALEYLGLTTPDALSLQTVFQRFRSNPAEPVSVVAMEASSIGLEQGRMAGTSIHTAVFTNLTRDHLDYHGSMECYGQAKRALFAWPTLQAAVVNLGDPFARHIIDVLNAHPSAPRIIGYWYNSAYRNPGETGHADAVAAKMDEHARIRLATFFLLSAQCDEVLELTQGEEPGRYVLMMFPGRRLADFARESQGSTAPGEANAAQAAEDAQRRDEARKAMTGAMFRNVAVLSLDILGRFNMENALAAAGSWRALGWNFPLVAQGMQQLQPVPGRMEVVPAGADILDTARPLVVVDYAHTPDALDNVLSALRDVAEQRGGKLCCVFGAGGNRDRGKRPDMARTAGMRADRIVLTSDNPRNEDPQQILDDVAAGLREPAWRIEADRRVAIDAAIAGASAADVVLIAGKGRETTQEIAGVFHPFSDPDIAAQALEKHWPAGAVPTASAASPSVASSSAASPVQGSAADMPAAGAAGSAGPSGPREPSGLTGSAGSGEGAHV